VKISQVLSLAASAIEALSGAGIKIPASILNIVSAAPAAITAGEAVVTTVLPTVSSIVTTGKFSIPVAVSEIATAAALIPVTGNAVADAAIKELVSITSVVSADLSNLLAGQAVSLASETVTLSGKSLNIHIVAIASGGPAAQSIGL
jgi:hypothetical protein